MPAINPGTVPLSLEFWLNWSGVIPGAGGGNTVYVWTCGGKSSYGSAMQLTIDGGASPPTIYFRWGQSGNGGPYIEKTFPIRQGEWHHYLWTRNGARATLYVDGINVGNGTGVNSWSSTSTAMDGTQYFNEPATNFYFAGGFQGYISNWRLISNQEIVSGDFTPSTNGLTATAIGHTGANVASSITGTVQELFFSTYAPWKDQSSNNRVPATYLTSVYGSAMSPFVTNNPYSIETQGGSSFFDGTGDYLTSSGNAAFDITQGDFTIEAWIYRNTNGTEDNILVYRPAGSGTTGWVFRIDATNFVTFAYIGNGANGTLTSTLAIAINAWTHIAVTRSGATGRLYINGTVNVTGTSFSNGTSPSTATQLKIGADDANGNLIVGNLSDVRIVKGQALASGSFTPPTAPLTRTAIGWTGANVAGSLTGSVSLLLNFTNFSIFDQCSKLALETVSSAQVYAPTTVDSNIKFGKSSVYFPGSPSYLFGVNSAAFNIGTCDFTIELWVKPSSVAAAQGLVGVSGGSGTVPKFVVHLGAGGTPSIHYNGLTNGSAIYTTATRAISANVWSHLMFVRFNGNWYWFVNGILSGTGTNSTNILFTTQPIYVGYGAEASFPHFTGYMSDIRLTRGVARRLANFTPPLSMSQNQ